MMIVEDDRAAIEILAFMIPRKYPQFTVELAFDGQMGLELFKERRPDLVITDINMPKMDGITMSEGIKEIAPDTRIIVMTAYSDKIHQDKFSELGISDYLLKPIEFGKLFAAIEKATRELRPERC